MDNTCKTYQNINSVDLSFIMNCIREYQSVKNREPRFLKLSLLSKESLIDEACKRLKTPHEFKTVMGVFIRWSSDIKPNQLIISHFDFMLAK